MNLRNILTALGFGVLFGFVLSRLEATHYNTIADMFLLRDIHLYGVIGSAVVVGAIGVALIQRYRIRSLDGTPIDTAPRDLHWGNLTGGALFGAGWAIAGACPGTSIAALGQGYWEALFVIGGMVAGVWLYGKVGVPNEAWLKKPLGVGNRPTGNAPQAVLKPAGQSGAA